MVLSSCLIQLAAIVITFNGQKSLVNITRPTLSGFISSMVLQFRTTQSNSQIASMMSGSQSFVVNIRDGNLKLEYNFNLTGNGSIDVGLVNTNKWFLLNITSREKSSTIIHLRESDNSITAPCVSKFTATKNITLLGQEFSNLLHTSGLIIGGPTTEKRLTSFKGCIGLFSLDNHRDLLNESKDSQPFMRKIIGTSKGCYCGKDPCVNGSYIWDRTKGKCECKCSLGYNGQFCQNETMTEVSDEESVDSKFIYIVVGVAVCVLLLVTLVVCVVMYIKRTNSSVFGVYNPKSQEQVQGQQMNTAFTLPVPEKLI